MTFQSTRPVWAATVRFAQLLEFGEVSIHAARVGRDRHGVVVVTPQHAFQSTRPVWAATSAIESR